MKKVLVTGYRGFIGQNLVSTLQEKNYEVVSIDDEYLTENWVNNLFEILCQDFDCIFHVGACSDTLETDVNYMMLRNYETTKYISDYCSHTNTPLIYSSSAANYGTNNEIPSNLYGWSKYVSEDYVLKNDGIALRYFNVYGPHEEHKGKMSSVAYQSFVKYKNNIEVKLFPKNPLRDFVYVKDIVSANLHAWEYYEVYKSNYFDVGSGEARPFEDVLNLMKIPFTYTDESVIPNGYQFYTCSNSRKWIPGWEPSWLLEKGIEDYKKYLYERN